MYNHRVRIKSLGRLAYSLSIAFLIAAIVTALLPAQSTVAGSGSIWTTNEGCDTPAAQDDNSYAVGEWVHIRGSNFNAGATLTWTITGQPGGASGDPRIVVATGTVTTTPANTTDPNGPGYFCVQAYQVATDDWGTYTVDVTGASKNDNYRVEALTPTYGLTLLKSASPGTYTAVGQTINYGYLLTNTGNSPLSGIVVTDDKVSVTCPGTTIDVGATMLCTASYVITQADMDSGSVTNLATADSAEIAPVTDTETVTIIRQYGISLTKAASPTTYDSIGDLIGYTYVVSNTGNSTLTGVTVTDNKASVSCPFSSLAAGASMTCTASYSITGGDMSTGYVTNTATADSNETDPTTAMRTVNLVQVYNLDLVKTASPANYDAVGDVINYTYLVTNNSNSPISSVSVTDNKAAVSCPSTSLAAGASMTCTASYTIVDADMLAGSVTNVATATSAQVGPVSDTETVNLIRIYGMTMDKSAAPATYNTVGQVINYTYLVRNTGNVAITGITVMDNKAAVTCTYTTLAAGASMTCTASYHITQDDLDAGSVTNIATADSNETGEVADSETVRASQSSAMSFDKAASPAVYDEVGDVINYAYYLTNNGNITMTGIIVTDDKATVTCPAATLAAGATMTCTASYVVTQADIDTGFVTNIASADSAQTNPVTDTETVRAVKAASITVDKTAAPTSYDSVGDVIGYSYLVRNMGNVTLTNVVVTDNKATVNCPATTLTVGGSMTCSASYAVTQADLDAGSVTNIATATSTQAGPATDTETVLANQNAGLVLDKTANPVDYDEVGDVINYSYLINNTGNVLLTNVVVTDNKVTVTCPANVLAAGASMTCSSTYAITQADMDAGSVTNIAEAKSDQTGSIRDLATVTTSAQDPQLTLEKVVNELQYSKAGDVLTYAYTVTNVGNVTITGISVIDDKTTVTCPQTDLAPAGSMVCTATYIVKSADMEADGITNTAQAQGVFIETEVLSNQAQVSVPRFLPLDLTPICSDDPAAADGWRVDNPNPYDVDFEFNILEGVAGTGMVPMNSYAIILTPVGSGTGILVLYVGGVIQDSGVPRQDCVKNDEPPDGNDNPPVVLDVPVVLIPVTGAIGGDDGAPILIPVTGVDFSAHRALVGTLFSLSLMFAGLGTVLGGVARRRQF